MASERELGLEQALERVEALLGEVANRVLCERLVREFGQRLAAPERERLSERLGGPPWVGFDVQPPPRCEPLEPVRIDDVRIDVEQVAGRTGEDDAVPQWRDGPPELRDEPLERLGGGRRRRLAPEGVDQRVGRDDLVGPQSENGQQRALPPAAELQHTAVRRQLEQAEKPDLHRARILHDRDARVYAADAVRVATAVECRGRPGGASPGGPRPP